MAEAETAGLEDVDALERALVPDPPRYAHTFWLARRGLGLTSLVAWISLAAQEDSLFGPGGVVPFDVRVEGLLDHFGALDATLNAPSLFYFVGAGANGLGLVTALGVGASMALLLGVLPGPASLVSYVAYLSFVSLGVPFLPLQWDTLLCEALVLGAVISPWTLSDPWVTAREPVLVARLAAWLLPTRLLFASGLVKLLGGDPTWRDGTAMAFHYWTQPLPSPLAPWAHALPPWFHALETGLTLVLEIGLPLLVFFGLRARAVLAAGIAILMALIAATGSYGFFNLLTVVLALALVDDATLERVTRRPIRRSRNGRGGPARPSRVVTGLAGALVVLGALELVTSIGLSPIVPDVVEDATSTISPWRLTNGYGLFANMTTDRDELVFLATEDGEHWAEYDFRYKPGAPERGPSWCTPHLPRFDWMLWFAALGDRESAPWVARVERGLREGRPSIRALFADEPFDGRPPRAIRVVRRRYTFRNGGWERGPERPW